MSAFDELYSMTGGPTLQAQLGRPVLLIRAATDAGPEKLIQLTNAIVLNQPGRHVEKPDGSRQFEEVKDVRIGTDVTSEFGGAADVSFADAFEIDGLRWEIDEPLDGDSIEGFRVVRRGAIEVTRRNTRNVCPIGDPWIMVIQNGVWVSLITISIALTGWDMAVYRRRIDSVDKRILLLIDSIQEVKQGYSRMSGVAKSVNEATEKRLDRMESKLDRLIENLGK